jgi:AcrR family transcriptional regulator
MAAQRTRTLSRSRRTQILQAAVETISERGLCDVRIADIASRAGTSAALLIYYFKTKDRLLADALAYSEEQFYGQTERELTALPTAVERLARLVELSCSVGAVGKTPLLDEWVLWLDMWARAPRDPDVARDREQMDRKFRAVIADVVRSGQESGEFDTEVDVDDVSLRMAAVMDGLAIQVVLGDPEVSPSRMFELCMRMASHELGFDWEPVRPSRRLPGRRSVPRSPKRRASAAAGATP